MSFPRRFLAVPYVAVSVSPVLRLLIGSEMVQVLLPQTHPDILHAHEKQRHSDACEAKNSVYSVSAIVYKVMRTHW